MKPGMMRSLTWSPTIALSWLWGLGFFYSIEVTLTHGLAGFLCFAIPNALGLFFFGWLLGAKKNRASKCLQLLGSNYTALFLLGQLFAVAVTIFAVYSYALEPAAQSAAAAYLGVILLAGCTIGHSADVNRLKLLHIWLLKIGLVGAIIAGCALASTAKHSPAGEIDGRFLGLLPAIVVGFLLGPWTDLQQWARAAAIERDGASVRLAYFGGAALFFLLISTNAVLAILAGPAAVTVSSDGISGAYASVTAALLRPGLQLPLAGFLLWVAIAAVSTFDSSYNALRTHFAGQFAKSNSPLLAFIPESVASSPLWLMGAAALLAAAAVQAKLSLIYLMAPFATLLAAPAASFLLSSIGYKGKPDTTFSLLVGATAGLILYEGYTSGSGVLEAIAPCVALIGCMHVLRSRALTTAVDTAVEPELAALTVRADASKAELIGSSHGFQDGWFVYNFVPTYDDTNSVGNVYFANYVRWVGKARELFFDVCMPDFDLKTTDFYVLTRSLRHDFRLEAREFEPIQVRIRIGSHNRKFVTLDHEIISLRQGLLGSGDQSLMFVDASNWRLLDIPRSIVKGFASHWPKGSPHLPPSLTEALKPTVPA